MSDRIIPEATKRRMPIYYKYFKTQQEAGTKRVSSKSISDSLDIDSATIRRDFSYFGELGRKGYGYNIDSLVDFFSEQIFGKTVKKVAIIGVGNLGSAFLRYNFGGNVSNSMQLVAGFDIDETVIGKTIGNCVVYNMDELNHIVKEKNINIAILTVPKESAQEAKIAIENAGIHGIMNFAPVKLTGHEGLVIHDVDITLELQSLCFNMKLSRGE